MNASNLLPSIHDSSVFSQGWKAVVSLITQSIASAYSLSERELERSKRASKYGNSASGPKESYRITRTGKDRQVSNIFLVAALEKLISFGRKIRSSLEADVLIILPDNARANTLGQLLYSQREQ